MADSVVNSAAVRLSAAQKASDLVNTARVFSNRAGDSTMFAQGSGAGEKGYLEHIKGDLGQFVENGLNGVNGIEPYNGDKPTVDASSEQNGDVASPRSP
jgi:hypothetical protein